MENIKVGSLVEFLEEYQSQTIPNVGIVLEVISFDELLGEELDEVSHGTLYYLET